jgi:hypothetical protein
MQYETKPTGHTVKNMRAAEATTREEKRMVFSGFFPEGSHHVQVKEDKRASDEPARYFPEGGNQQALVAKIEKRVSDVPAEFFDNKKHVEKHEFIQGVI